jgi:tRNA U34 5-methylaminomethyl-2-thiouridine-forming methyltransferase MnmC
MWLVIQPMRFDLHPTSDGSLTVFDRDAGECFKSRHAARTEAEHVFFGPGVRENPHYGKALPFRVLELGLGLGTNFQHCREQGFEGEFVTIERDLAGLRFYLEHAKPDSELALLAETGKMEQGSFSARLLESDFESALPLLGFEGFRAHAIFFDPFSPKANPGCWTPAFFRLAAHLLVPGGRLVTYSVSRIAKDSAEAAGLIVEKRKLPAELKKRSALLALKPNP